MFIRDEFGEMSFAPSSLCCIAGGGPASGGAASGGVGGPGGPAGGSGGPNGGNDNGRGGSERLRPVEPKIKAKRVKKTKNQNKLLSDRDTIAESPVDPLPLEEGAFAAKRRQGRGGSILAGRGLGDSSGGPSISRATLG